MCHTSMKFLDQLSRSNSRFSKENTCLIGSEIRISMAWNRTQEPLYTFAHEECLRKRWKVFSLEGKQHKRENVTLTLCVNVLLRSDMSAPLYRCLKLNFITSLNYWICKQKCLTLDLVLFSTTRFDPDCCRLEVAQYIKASAYSVIVSSFFWNWVRVHIYTFGCVVNLAGYMVISNIYNT
jgi:hypothetical protein